VAPVRVTLDRRPLVHGVVRSADGAPVAGATVMLHMAEFEDGRPSLVSMDPFAGTTTDAAGRYELPADEPEGFVLAVSSPGFASQDSAPIQRAVGRFDYVQDFRLERGDTVTANVADLATGHPVAEVFAMWKRRPGWYDGHPPFADEAIGERSRAPGLPFRAVSDADGRLRMEHLAAGDYDVCLWTPDAVPEFTTLHVPAQTPPAWTIRRSQSIAGRVQLADGTPVPGAWVALAAPDGRPFYVDTHGHGIGAAADERGAFRLDAVGTGTYRLLVGATGLGQDGTCATLSDPIVAGATDVLVIVVPGRSLRGRLLGAGGRPVEKVSVICDSEDGSSLSRHVVTTGEDGTFVVRAMDATPHSLVAFGKETAAIRLHAVAGADPVELQLAAGRTVTGVLVEADGKPVGGQELEVRRTSDDRMWIGSRQFTTDAGGRFRIPGLLAASYFVDFHVGAGGGTGPGPDSWLELVDTTIDAGSPNVTLHCKRVWAHGRGPSPDKR
jgi:hypothetical protein